MQGSFVFDKTSVRPDGMVCGRFRATGIRPKCAERLAASGMRLPAEMFGVRQGGCLSQVLDADSRSRVRRRLSIIFVPYWMIVDRSEEREERALRKRLRVRRTAALGPAIVGAQERLTALGHFDAILMRGRAAAALQEFVTESRLKLTVGGLLLACALAAVVVFILVFSATSSALLAVATAALVASVAGALRSTGQAEAPRGVRRTVPGGNRSHRQVCERVTPLRRPFNW